MSFKKYVSDESKVSGSNSVRSVVHGLSLASGVSRKKLVGGVWKLFVSSKLEDIGEASVPGPEDPEGAMLRQFSACVMNYKKLQDSDDCVGLHSIGLDLWGRCALFIFELNSKDSERQILAETRRF